MKTLAKFLVFLFLALFLAPALPTANAAPAKAKVLIGFKQKVDQQLVEGMGGKVKHKYRVVSAVAAEVPEAVLAKLAKHPGVAYVEPDIEVKALGDTVPWGIDRIDAELVQPYNLGTGIKVCVIDTGIDYTHPDLDANYKGGIDYVNDDLDPLDDNGHGTHCAGIIAAEADGAGIVGVAPGASLYAVKALGASGSGLLSDVVAGIDWAVANGMDIVSMSLGSSLPSLTLEAACNNAYAAGVLLVAAAGNSGPPRGNNSTVNYPARYSSVIAVSATDSNDAFATFSSAGPEVELAAPGVAIYSTLPTYTVTLTSTYGLNYGTLNGTSMACPHVSGTAALAMATYPSYTNLEIRSLLQNTADDLGVAGVDRYYGYGLVDADEAAPNLVPDTTPPVISSVAASTTATTATITWVTDEPATSMVNYGTTTALGSTVTDTTLTTTHSVTLTGLSPETAYYFEVQSADAAGNLTTDNNGGLFYSFTTPAAPANSVSIADITMSTTTYKYRGRYYYTYATALVTVVDQDGNPVTGATVSGHWSGLTADLDTGVTDTLGQVALISDTVLNAAGTFTFTVDDVTLEGYTYDPAANVETSDSITV